MIGFCYGGQGSQIAGMGKDFYETDARVRARFDVHPEVRDIIFAEADARLHETRWAQLALALYALAVTDVLADEGIRPDVAMGLSLGEYGALYAAGVLDAAAVMRLLTVRGAAMEAACREHPGVMRAVLGMSEEEVAALADRLRRETGVDVWLANANMPAQQVIGGSAAGCDAFEEAATDAKRIVPLNVSGAFHTPYMASAATALAEALAAEIVADGTVPVLSNVTGTVLTSDVRRELCSQLTAPVRCAASLEEMARLGVTDFVEIGQGKVLSGFVRKTLGKGVRVHSVARWEDVAELKAALGEKYE